MSLVESFHHSVAPGVLLGGFMVELAYQNLPSGKLFDVICETSKCLPDAVQLLTPCTIGNQWLKIIDVGRFAVAFYDKYSGEGARVNLEQSRLGPWPEINAWFLNYREKKMQDTQLLFSQIREAGTGIYQVRKIQVSREFLKKPRKSPMAVCPLCHEVYRADDGPICPACNGGRLPY